MSNVIDMFSGPIHEFKTKKAAEKYAKRIIGGAFVKKKLGSHFGFKPNKSNIFYGVYQK